MITRIALRDNGHLYVQQQPEEFRELLRDSERAAQELEAGLRHWKRMKQPAPVPDTLQSSADRITQNCKTCHQKYRDLPLDKN